MRVPALALLCACAASQPAQRSSSTPLAFAPLPDRRSQVLAAMPAVERLFAEAFEKQKFPGLSVGIVLDGELVWTRSWGVRDVATRAPADADTLFRIASMSKAFTAVAILKLRDEGKLRLDEPAETYLPELAQLSYPTRDAPRITVRDLLTHGSGFPEDNPSGDLTLPWSDARLLEIIRAGGQFSTAPGTRYEYSNLGFELLGMIAARVSGMEYSEYMRLNILRPLDMKTSTYDPAKADPAHVAQGYPKDSANAVPPLAYGAGAPMGGLYSSVRELAKWAAFQLDAWPPRDGDEGRVLRRASRREAQRAWRQIGFGFQRETADAPLLGTMTGYGYGWGAGQTCTLESFVTHSGGLPGFGSNIRLLPERGAAIIALANQTYAPVARLTALAAELLAPALPVRKPLPAPALEKALRGLEALYAQPSRAAQDPLWDPQVLAYLDPDRQLDGVRKLREQHGTCRRTDFDAQNALRGTLRLSCERGELSAFVTLGPQTPALVQQLDWTSWVPADAPQASVARTAAALLSGWDDGRFASIAAPALDRELTHARFTLLRHDFGACTVEPLVRFSQRDARQEAHFRVQCERGKLELRVALDDRGRATELFLAPDGRCAY